MSINTALMWDSVDYIFSNTLSRKPGRGLFRPSLCPDPDPNKNAGDHSGDADRQSWTRQIGAAFGQSKSNSSSRSPGPATFSARSSSRGCCSGQTVATSGGSDSNVART